MLVFQHYEFSNSNLKSWKFLIPMNNMKVFPSLIALLWPWPEEALRACTMFKLRLWPTSRMESLFSIILVKHATYIEWRKKRGLLKISVMNLTFLQLIKFTPRPCSVSKCKINQPRLTRTILRSMIKTNQKQKHQM